MGTEFIEQLLENLINTQNKSSKELKKLITAHQLELSKISNSQSIEELKQIIIRQSSEIQAIKELNSTLDISKYLKNEPTKNITIFGGADAQIIYKWALLFIGFIYFSYLGFNHIPTYLNESKKIEETTLMTKRFVDFERLKNFEKNGNTEEIDKHIQMIYNNDSLFTTNYKRLNSLYHKEKKRLKLEREKKGIEDKINSLK